MRINTHEIDTQARKIVPLALPRQWEYREVTGRDYGIDMEVELFENKVSTGQNLLVQIKGTEKDIIFEDGFSPFDIPTKTLMYSENFINPFILAVCNINDENKKIYYVWLQDYIKSVLNFENPDWKKNKYTTRVKLPESNVMPGDEKHLTHISHFPQRLYGACEVARILHDTSYSLDGDPSPHNYHDVSEKLQSILNLPGYLNSQWSRGEFVRSQYLQPAHLSSCLLSEQRGPTEEEAKSMPEYSSLSSSLQQKSGMNKDEAINYALKVQLSHGLNCMSFFFEETNYGLKNFFWNEEKSHEF
jgi:hypothetical protein